MYIYFVYNGKIKFLLMVLLQSLDVKFILSTELPQS